MKILIVEDERSLALMLRFILHSAGHEILGPVSTVRDALLIVENNIPDLALIDIYLADGSEGTTLARFLRVKGDTAILFTTADTEKAQTYSSYALGLLQKPYPLSSILPAVQVVESIQRGKKIKDIPRALRLFRFPHELQSIPIAVAELSERETPLSSVIASV